jgi:hypothetical protein
MTKTEEQLVDISCWLQGIKDSLEEISESLKTIAENI